VTDSPSVVIDRHAVETVSIDELRPHPRNYNTHPDTQIEHLSESLREHGLYRNVVVANDGTILAGHGVVEAARSMNAETIDVVRLDIDPDSLEAIKVLVGDNELPRLAVINENMLNEHMQMLREAEALLGTGIDESTFDAPESVTIPSVEEQLAAVTYSVLIDCENETQQSELGTRLEAEGFNVRLLMA
jgi:hypothetical protein